MLDCECWKFWKKVSRDDPKIAEEWAVKDAIDFRNRVL
ncbi:hypothetical protein PAP_07275 [Palaeococcus pacificus DY20341]|uniref:Uncharacterized protein n=1 Tax=Palaeococcus pacificus DY20341 TaxID=1343739 RepID=A0A075LSW5_9EURY|nr:hypothetical protein PAP_07275 [Palaeococcus pacificus DY20341]